jgi:hypothetical protein
MGSLKLSSSSVCNGKEISGIPVLYDTGYSIYLPSPLGVGEGEKTFRFAVSDVGSKACPHEGTAINANFKRHIPFNRLLNFTKLMLLFILYLNSIKIIKIYSP